MTIEKEPDSSKMNERRAVQQPLLEKMTLEDEKPPKDRFFMILNITFQSNVLHLN